MATRNHSTNMRGRLPHDIRPYEHAIHAVTLADRHPECRCVWVPWWTLVTRDAPWRSLTTLPVLSYQVAGFVRKFTDRDCPVIRHLA